MTKNKPPVPKHGMTRSNGVPNTYEAQTSKPCPGCNQGGFEFPERHLALVMKVDNTCVLECPNCALDMHMHVDEYTAFYAPDAIKPRFV